MFEKQKVLIVCSSKETIKSIHEAIPTTKYTLTSASSLLEAKQILTRLKFNFCILVSPLKDGPGIQGAREIIRNHDMRILLIVKSDVYDQAVYQLRENGVFVLSLPTSKKMIYQSIELLDVMNIALNKANHEISKLKKKINDIQIINRAKLLLIEQYHYTEEKAHQYIEKTAMNNSITKVDVAKNILEMKGQYED